MADIKRVQLRDAKARFSSMVTDAQRGEPTIITRDGKPEAVVLGFDEWERLRRYSLGFGEMLASCPLEEGDLPERHWPMRSPPDL